MIAITGMALSQLLSLKSDLELALGPLSTKYFDTLAVVLNEVSSKPFHGATRTPAKLVGYRMSHQLLQQRYRSCRDS